MNEARAGTLVHQCNNYVVSAVHEQLVRALSERGVDQEVVIPVRCEADRRRVLNTPPGGVVYTPRRYPNWLRFLPFLKALLIACCCFPRYLRRRPRGEPLRVIAHNFWSDGLVVFLLSTVLPIRFVVVVRNTDINVFIPRLPHYRWLMGIMLRRARGVVFVSEAHRRRFRQRWPRLETAAGGRISVIGNGLDRFWLDNMDSGNAQRPDRVLFVGAFDQNKNLRNLVDACGLLAARRGPDFELVVVGGSEEAFCDCTGREQAPPFVRVAGFVTDKSRLMQWYREARVLAVPSYRETFGLVYLEALSQGTAVLHSIGEGIDGMFEDTAAVRAVDPYRVESIRDGLERLLDSASAGVALDTRRAAMALADWEGISERYLASFS